MLTISIFYHYQLVIVPTVEVPQKTIVVTSIFGPICLQVSWLSGYLIDVFEVLSRSSDWCDLVQVPPPI